MCKTEYRLQNWCNFKRHWATGKQCRPLCVKWWKHNDWSLENRRSVAILSESVTFRSLTLSNPVILNCYTSKCSRPYWSNPAFFLFLTFGHSYAQDWAPECPNVKQFFKWWVRPVWRLTLCGRLILPQLWKCGNEMVNTYAWRSTDRLETARCLTSLHRDLFQCQKTWTQRKMAQSTSCLQRNIKI